MTEHYDPRTTNVMDDTVGAPGADDGGSGTAAVAEATHVLSRHRFEASIASGVPAGKQGLYGGRLMAQEAKHRGRNGNESPVAYPRPER